MSSSRPPLARPSSSDKQLRVAGSYRQDIVVLALSLIGTEYRYGGDNPEDGLDCSGLVSHVFKTVANLALPHNAGKIAASAAPVSRADLAPGDLVFFNTLGRAYSHMGIYIGDGQFLHAPRKGERVRLDRLDNPYYSSRLNATKTIFLP